MPFHYEYAEAYDNLLDDIHKYYNKEEHYGDDTWYYDAKHEVIDNYVSNNDYEAKEVVNKYGVFKLIQEYENQYDEFVIDKCELTNYMKLYFHLIDNYIMENHIKDLENLCIEDSDDDSTH